MLYRLHRLAVTIVLLSSLLLSACADEAVSPPEARITPVPTAPRPTAAPREPSTDGQTWLVMVYADADDEILEYDIFTDVNEMERVGSSDQLTIAVQLDRYDGGFDGDGDWTGTHRYVLEQDDDLSSIASPLAEDLGEVNMADRASLVDFAVWAMSEYPADRYALILSDHGMGWPGGWSDPDPAQSGPDGLELTSDGDLLLVDELATALEEITAQTGVARLDLFGFDACLMGHLEVAVALAPTVDVMVASQELEPAMGWAYAATLEQLAADPGQSALELGQAFVDNYIAQDLRITDDDARAELVSENFNEGADLTAAEVAAAFSEDITLSAIDLRNLPLLLDAFDQFIAALSTIDQKLVAEARRYTQTFENVFDPDATDSYLDLGHFAAMIADVSQDETISNAADELTQALNTVVVANQRGTLRPGATGLSIYFPDSGLYESSIAGADVYTQVASAFAAETRWDDLLALHYYDVPLGDAPAADAVISAPGAAPLQVSAIRLSAERINIADSVTLAAEVTGAPVGFVYTFTGYYNPDDDTILIADRDYIDAGASREVNGINYPDWGNSDVIEIEFEWSPMLYAIDDGSGDGLIFALLDTSDYGADNESATYVVEGTYTSRAGNSRPAQLFFRDGDLVRVVGYSGAIGASLPRTLTLKDGDSFTVTHQLLELHSDEPDTPVSLRREPGETLVYNGTPWTVSELQAPSGDYVLGIQADDIDGNRVENYTTITVDE